MGWLNSNLEVLLEVVSHPFNLRLVFEKDAFDLTLKVLLKHWYQGSHKFCNGFMEYTMKVIDLPEGIFL